LVPLSVIALGLVFTAARMLAARSREKVEKIKEASWGYLITFLYLIFSSVTTVIFSTFSVSGEPLGATRRGGELT
jgi:uncharacterized membrane protein YecN with MAPEG domain